METGKIQRTSAPARSPGKRLTADKAAPEAADAFVRGERGNPAENELAQMAALTGKKAAEMLFDSSKAEEVAKEEIG